jgi:5'-nucleotidase
LYTQAAYHGIRLGRVELVYDTEKRLVTKREARTVLMDASIPGETNLLTLVRGELEAAAKHAGLVLGEADRPFEVRGAPKRETAVHELLCQAIAEGLAGKGIRVDGVLHGVLTEKAELSPGPVTMGDVWRLVPYENAIGVAELSLQELMEILDENAGAYDKKEFRGLWGLKSVLSPKAEPGKRCVSVRRSDGTELSADERVRVAFNSYDLASAGLRCPKLREIVDRPMSRLVEVELTTREALAAYIAARKRISPAVGEWWQAMPAR